MKLKTIFNLSPFAALIKALDTFAREHALGMFALLILWVICVGAACAYLYFIYIIILLTA